MGRARASVVVVGTVEDAEGLWYDSNRWPAFVDGFSHVVRLDAEWPRDGTLVWTSTPAGRGRVVERVTAHEAGRGQVLAVEDERLRGTQTVAFAQERDGTRVTVTLDYEIKDRNVLTPLLDALFVRRAMNDALRRTLGRFARERRSDAELT